MRRGVFCRFLCRSGRLFVRLDRLLFFFTDLALFAFERLARAQIDHAVGGDIHADELLVAVHRAVLGVIDRRLGVVSAELDRVAVEGDLVLSHLRHAHAIALAADGAEVDDRDRIVALLVIAHEGDDVLRVVVDDDPLEAVIAAIEVVHLGVGEVVLVEFFDKQITTNLNHIVILL